MYLHWTKISTRKVSNIPIPHGHPNFQTFPLIVESHLITILVHFTPISLSSKATWKKMTLSLLCCSICEFIKTFLLWLMFPFILTFIVSADFVGISSSTHFPLCGLVGLCHPCHVSMVSYGSCYTTMTINFSTPIKSIII